jgi:hypothetical protein
VGYPGALKDDGDNPPRGLTPQGGDDPLFLLTKPPPRRIIAPATERPSSIHYDFREQTQGEGQSAMPCNMTTVVGLVLEIGNVDSVSQPVHPLDLSDREGATPS